MKESWSRLCKGLGQQHTGVFRNRREADRERGMINVIVIQPWRGLLVMGMCSRGKGQSLNFPEKSTDRILLPC